MSVIFRNSDLLALSRIFILTYFQKLILLLALVHTLSSTITNKMLFINKLQREGKRKRLRDTGRHRERENKIKVTYTCVTTA